MKKLLSIGMALAAGIVVVGAIPAVAATEDGDASPAVRLVAAPPAGPAALQPVPVADDAGIARMVSLADFRDGGFAEHHARIFPHQGIGVGAVDDPDETDEAAEADRNAQVTTSRVTPALLY